MIFDRNDKEMTTLTKYIDFKNKNILEFCCGSSMYANRLPQTYKSYIGVDLDKEGISASKKQCKNVNAKYVCANIMNYTAEEKKDICIGTLALHEIDIKEQGLALNNLINNTKKNGLIVILDPVINKVCFQELWNVVYREFISFEHDYTVKNAEFAIQNVIKQGLVVKEIEKKVELPIELESKKEIYEMFTTCYDFKDIFENKKNVLKLKTVVNAYLAENNIKDVIFDKLKLTILKKV